MDNNTLYHYGVLGMKWGRRKSRTSSGTTRSKRSSTESQDYIRAKSLQKKKISQLSNAELKELNNRKQLEVQYKNLTKKKNVGKKIVSGIITTAGTIVALEGAIGTYKRVGNSALDKIGDWVVRDIKF